jgi:hypothetical protein
LTPTRRIIATLAALGLLAALAACSTRPPVDELWLFYMNGPIDKKEFKSCVEPNTKGAWKANNDTFALPTSLRTWNVAPQGGDSNTPTVVGSKPDAAGQAGPQVGIWSTVEFYLNTNCDDGAKSPAVQFWEKTGRRYQVSDGSAIFNEGKWVTVLQNTLVPVQSKALQRVARDYTADEMDTNINDTWRKMEDAIQTEFTEQLRLKVGGDYFCGVTYNRASKECPPVRVSITDINYMDLTVQNKRAEVRAAAEDAKKRLIEAQAKVDEAKLLSQAARDANYMRLKELETFLQSAQACANNPNCTLVITPPGGGVNVNTR